jgi:hypothetical protein
MLQQPVHHLILKPLAEFVLEFALFVLVDDGDFYVGVFGFDGGAELEGFWAGSEDC